MTNQALTKKQKKVLAFIENYTKKNGQSPTTMEIAISFDLSSKATVSEYVAALEKKGFLRRIPGAYRGIVLNKEDEGDIELPLYPIPLMGRVAAGQPIEAVEDVQTLLVPRRLIPKPSRKYFALEVKGDSMIEDGIYNGEVIIVESRNFADNGDLVVAKDQNENVTLKYYYREHNRIRLEPRNSKYQPIYLDYCEILGLFRGITTKNIQEPI